MPGALCSTSCYLGRRPTYVAFDLLMADGVDLRSLPLRERKAMLARIGKRARAGLHSLTGEVRTYAAPPWLGFAPCSGWVDENPISLVEAGQ
jgi:hypothetical protein